MTIINCYAVISNGEDGRGKSVLEARFKEYKDAKEIFTSGLYHIQAETIVIFDNAGDFRTNNDDARKKRALSKLTQDERRLLGLK